MVTTLPWLWASTIVAPVSSEARATPPVSAMLVVMVSVSGYVPGAISTLSPSTVLFSALWMVWQADDELMQEFPLSPWAWST